MSNEEQEIKRENQGAIFRASPQDYARVVSNSAVAQICQALGFQSLNKSSLESLSNILIQFIRDLAKTAKFHANLSGRTDSNLFDVIEGFIDLGFTSSSSQFVKQMSDFVNCVEDNPFAHPITRFPVVVTNKGFAPSFSQMGENPGGKHIPDWLPAFPDPHTYVHTPLWSQRKLDPRIDKGEQARQRRKAERSLLNLQQRLLSSGGGGGGGGENGVYMEENPGKGVEDCVYEKKHLLVKEAFAPAIDALKGDGDDDDDDDDLNAMDVDKRVMSAKRRPVVHFKMKAGKKMLVEDLDVHIRSLVCEKRGSFARDDDKDDKKRRGEYILRQSAIEFPQEVSQL